MRTRPAPPRPQPLKTWMQRHPHETSLALRWLGELRGDTFEEFERWVLDNLIADLETAKSILGYEAIYFGVACAVFPEETAEEGTP